MRILNLGGNYLVSALEAAGHSVVSVGLSERNTLTIRHPITWSRLEQELAAQGFAPDAALWVDEGNLPFLLGLEKMPFPAMLYSIDTFCNPWHIPFTYAFDAALVAQKGHVELFPRLVEPPQWLPLFAPDALFEPPVNAEEEPTERTIPVSFVGTLRPKNIPHRSAFLAAFRRGHPLFSKQGAYEPVFRRSQIVLNQTAVQELNFRCFESMACGAALLTEAGPHGFEDLFTPGESVLPPYTLGNAEEAVRIARIWLAQPERLRAIATAGQHVVRTQHTASNRAALVVHCLERLVQGQGHEQRLKQIEKRQILLSTAYAILAAELQADGVRDHQGLYQKAFEQSRL